jgi:hypothetical protein
MAVNRRQVVRLVPQVEGRRVDFPARQLRHAPGRLLQAQRYGRRFGQHRIKPAARLPLQDQNPHQVVDVGWEGVARSQTRGNEPRMHRIHQLLS